MKVKFCVLLICLWNFLLILASSPEVVKRSAEDSDSVFPENFDSSIDYYHHHYHPHRHPRPPPRHNYHPRPDNYNAPPRTESYPWRLGFGPPRHRHHPEHSFREPTWDQNPWDGPPHKWPSSVGSTPGTDEYIDFDKETKDSQDNEQGSDCHCKFKNVGSRTVVTVSYKRKPTMTTPQTTTSTSATLMTTTTTTPTTTTTTPTTTSSSTSTEFDWNTYVEKELSDDPSKNNTAGIGVIDVRVQGSD